MCLVSALKRVKLKALFSWLALRFSVTLCYLTFCLGAGLAGVAGVLAIQPRFSDVSVSAKGQLDLAALYQ